MELPQKPQLEHQQRVGQYGEIVIELTPESEAAYSKYLRDLHFAKIAIRSLNETTEITDAERSTS